MLVDHLPSNLDRRYSQTEREALAIVCGCERFHLYLYGELFVIHSDHKPLQYLFNNLLSKPPAGIERWQLHLEPYGNSILNLMTYDCLVSAWKGQSG